MVAVTTIYDNHMTMMVTLTLMQASVTLDRHYITCMMTMTSDIIKLK